MFQQLKNKGVITRPADANGNGSINIIGAGTVIEGEIKSNGDIRVDGTIKGSVTSKAKVVVGSTGVIEGDVHCQNADISGAILGKTTVAEMLFMKSQARINGDIQTGKLVVEVGASFTGNCSMGPVIKDIKNADRPAQKLAEKTA
ncbi:MAG TPA: polymer-forming cytoskeletal protein [Bacteroidia bacterium]|nr:polymer-forming cytoskeletal protein [Bacteroidia bacterium]HQK97397.1 polymer-forming cytoskeletal protein [Bacteroidia bacterium]